VLESSDGTDEKLVHKKEGARRFSGQELRVAAKENL